MKELVTNEKLLERHGPKPIIQLPQDDEPLIDYVQAMAAELKDKGLYRRDRVVVVPIEGKRRLDVMEPKAFCSWSQRHVLTGKLKYDRNDNPYTVVRDMPTEAAEKTLMSHDFIPQIPEIAEVHPAPMPAIVDGVMTMQMPGYHEPTKTFTFPME